MQRFQAEVGVGGRREETEQETSREIGTGLEKQEQGHKKLWRPGAATWSFTDCMKLRSSVEVESGTSLSRTPPDAQLDPIQNSVRPHNATHLHRNEVAQQRHYVASAPQDLTVPPLLRAPPGAPG